MYVNRIEAKLSGQPINANLQTPTDTKATVSFTKEGQNTALFTKEYDLVAGQDNPIEFDAEAKGSKGTLSVTANGKTLTKTTTGPITDTG